jgi:hypothetical protein
MNAARRTAPILLAAAAAAAIGLATAPGAAAQTGNPPPKPSPAAQVNTSSRLPNPGRVVRGTFDNIRDRFEPRRVW